MFKQVNNKMKHPVTSLKTGDKGTISHFTDDEVAGKLMSMGILPGNPVKVVRIAPFNGGYYLWVDGTNLVLRTEEAQCIILESAAT